MHAAAQLLVGVHDFRNLCKIDVMNIDSFVRSGCQGEGGVSSFCSSADVGARVTSA